MIVLLDAFGAPLGIDPFDDLLDALPHSRTLGRRCIVARLAQDGSYTHLAYTGPDGWSGPSARPRGNLSYCFNLPRMAPISVPDLRTSDKEPQPS